MTLITPQRPRPKRLQPETHCFVLVRREDNRSDVRLGDLVKEVSAPRPPQVDILGHLPLCPCGTSPPTRGSLPADLFHEPITWEDAEWQ